MRRPDETAGRQREFRVGTRALDMLPSGLVGFPSDETALQADEPARPWRASAFSFPRMEEKR
jgi:hypothetical protein